MGDYFMHICCILREDLKQRRNLAAKKFESGKRLIIKAKEIQSDRRRNEA